MKSKLLVILSGLLVTGIANAECPSSLSKDELITCQSVEKAGTNYQEWKQAQIDMVKSTVSPITGKDVKSISPAAGKATEATAPVK